MRYTEEHLRAIKQVKAAARAVVALSSGLLAGAQQVRGSIGMLDPSLRIPHPAIDAFLAEVPNGIPLSESRLYVAEERLLETDSSLASIEISHRKAVLLECKSIYFACSEVQRLYALDIDA